MDAVKVLRAVWPTGIPTNDYGRVVDALARLTEAPAPRPSPPVPAPKPKADVEKAQRRQRWLDTRIVSETKVQEVRGLLEIQPATIKQLAEATGLSVASINWSVHRLKCVQAGKARPKRPGLNAPLLWRLP